MLVRALGGAALVVALTAAYLPLWAWFLDRAPRPRPPSAFHTPFTSTAALFVTLALTCAATRLIRRSSRPAAWALGFVLLNAVAAAAACLPHTTHAATAFLAAALVATPLLAILTWRGRLPLPS